MISGIKANLASIQGRIQKACATSGRLADTVELIAVTKTFSPDIIQQAYDLGLKQFGENKVQELLEKKPHLPKDIRWHMIGRLQTNKAKAVVAEADLIHSLDRLELFDKITQEARRQGRSCVNCLIQVNVSGEPSKAGFSLEDGENFLAQYDGQGPVQICGLMTMAPLTDDRTRIRGVFRAARGLFEKWRSLFPQHVWRHLSLGMSSDFEIAIEEGATMVRIGTALFGSRDGV